MDHTGFNYDFYYGSEENYLSGLPPVQTLTSPLPAVRIPLIVPQFQGEIFNPTGSRSNCYLTSYYGNCYLKGYDAVPSGDFVEAPENERLQEIGTRPNEFFAMMQENIVPNGAHAVVVLADPKGGECHRFNVSKSSGYGLNSYAEKGIHLIDFQNKAFLPKSWLEGYVGGGYSMSYKWYSNHGLDISALPVFNSVRMSYGEPIGPEARLPLSDSLSKGFHLASLPGFSTKETGKVGVSRTMLNNAFVLHSYDKSGNMRDGKWAAYFDDSNGEIGKQIDKATQERAKCLADWVLPDNRGNAMIYGSRDTRNQPYSFIHADTLDILGKDLLKTAEGHGLPLKLCFTDIGKGIIHYNTSIEPLSLKSSLGSATK